MVSTSRTRRVRVSSPSHMSDAERRVSRSSSSPAASRKRTTAPWLEPRRRDRRDPVGAAARPGSTSPRRRRRARGAGPRAGRRCTAGRRWRCRRPGCGRSRRRARRARARSAARAAAGGCRRWPRARSRPPRPSAAPRRPGRRATARAPAGRSPRAPRRAGRAGAGGGPSRATASAGTRPCSTASTSASPQGPCGPGIMRSSAARPAASVERPANQSVMTSPSKPHSPLSTSRQQRALAHRGAVHAVVRGHDGPRLRLGDHALERREVQLVQRPLVDPGVVGEALGLGVVADEVLDRGGDALALHAADVGDGDLGGEVRVLAQALEVAPAERGAVQVDGGGEQDVDVLAARLRGQQPAEPLDPGGVPGRGERRWGTGCWRTGRARPTARRARPAGPSEVTRRRRPTAGSGCSAQKSAPVRRRTCWAQRQPAEELLDRRVVGGDAGVEVGDAQLVAHAPLSTSAGAGGALPCRALRHAARADGGRGPLPGDAPAQAGRARDLALAWFFGLRASLATLATSAPLRVFLRKPMGPGYPSRAGLHLRLRRTRPRGSGVVGRDWHMSRSPRASSSGSRA